MIESHPSPTPQVPDTDMAGRPEAVYGAPGPVGGRPGPVTPTPGARSALRPLGLDAIRLDPAGLLGGWQERNARATLPHCITQLDEAGALPNLRREPGDQTPHVGMWFSDTDVYKTAEAVAWRLGSGPADTVLSAFLDMVADLLASRQGADGYLNSYFQHDHPEKRFKEVSWSHELYCAGHLIQAAVAAARSGVGERLVTVARRFADLLVERFGPDGEEAVDGHPEIETALVELYRVTGHEPYLDLARRFVDRRGRGLLPPGLFGSAYFQDHRPVREAEEFTGHAVRQLYLLAGVVDVAVETGDDSLLSAAERLWDSAFLTKTYLTGAHGSRHRDEAVGDPYELPADRAYGETCAAIGSFQWNWRMLLATGRHRYADEMERVLYNAIAGSTALDGEHFFYANPLHLRTGHDGTIEDAPSRRLSWYSCSCCPPNLARLLASLHGYVSTVDGSGIQLHLYGAGTIHSGHHAIGVRTGYPWDGGVNLAVESTVDDEWTLSLRVPSWCAAVAVQIDGVETDVRPVDGYLRLTRCWLGRTAVVVRFDMPARLVAPHPRIDAVRGCLALVRGPLVYGVEQADLPAGTVLEDVELAPAGELRVVGNGSGATVPVVLTAAGQIRDQPPETLYHDYAAGTRAATPVTLTAVPYFLWGNRDPGPMRVWIPATP